MLQKKLLLCVLFIILFVNIYVSMWFLKII